MWIVDIDGNIGADSIIGKSLEGQKMLYSK